MSAIYHVTKSHQTHPFRIWVLCLSDCFLFSGGTGIFGRPWENLDNGQVLEEWVELSSVQSLCNGNAQGRQPWSCSWFRTLRKLQHRHSEKLDHMGHPFLLISWPLALKSHELSKVPFILNISIEYVVCTSQLKIVFNIFMFEQLKASVNFLSLLGVYNQTIIEISIHVLWKHEI